MQSESEVAEHNREDDNIAAHRHRVFSEDQLVKWTTISLLTPATYVGSSASLLLLLLLMPMMTMT